MQDISRDDFSLLSGGDAASHSTDRDMCPTLVCKLENISASNFTATNLPIKIINESNEGPSCAAIKLEDINAIDLFPSNSSSWQQYPTHDLEEHQLFFNAHNTFEHNSTKLLLQGSDDPLISHGANNVLCNDDEHPADFAKNFSAQADNYYSNTVNVNNNQEEISKPSSPKKSPQRLVKSGCSNLTKQQLKVKANLMSARNQQQQQQQQQQTQNSTAALNITTTTSSANQKNQRNQKSKNKKGAAVKLRFHHQALPPEYLSHYEATQAQQQICKTTPTTFKASKTASNLQKQPQPRNSHENVRSWLQKIAEIQRSANASKQANTMQMQNSVADKAQCQSYSNKPYEHQNSLGRRTADANKKTQNVSISTHSNPHDGNRSEEVKTHLHTKRPAHYSDLPFMGEITLENCKPRRGRKPKKADICHLIYKNYGTILPNITKPANNNGTGTGTSNISLESPCFKNEQPLNLCLRDQPNDTYSISSGEELSETNSTCPTPVSTPLDYVRDSMLANNLQKSLDNINEHNDNEIANLDTSKSKQFDLSASEATAKATPPSFSMCYKKLLESGMLLNSNGQYKTLKKDNQLALKIPIPSGLFMPPKLENPPPTPVVLNSDYTLATAFASQSENTVATTNSFMPSQPLVAPQKRKRSAIFIPPTNMENSNNPATEVSICKFKFTGGSKPTLQEKKWISVDAGGNYRYFSGTGDKSSRGYEYFPRESLQQTAGLLPGVNCTGQKLCVDIVPSSSSSSHCLSNDLMQNPGTSNSSRLLPPDRTLSGSTSSISPKPTTASPSFEVSKTEACSLSIKEKYTTSYSSSRPPTTLTTSKCAVLLPKHNVIPPQTQPQPQPQLRKLTQKEKLEKTFKEQGFLIQTQQVESEEGATYCKFRQLKKFTRYLFRNWKAYLPSGIQENATNISPAFTSNTDAKLKTSAYGERFAINRPPTTSTL